MASEPISKRDGISPNMLLLIGVPLLFLSQVRWGVDLLAWVAPVPFLMFLKRTRGWRSRTTFLVVLCLAWTAASAKYLTPPWPKFMILLFGVTFGIINSLGYLLWDRLRRDLPLYLQNIAFGLIMVAFEWVLYRFTTKSPRSGQSKGATLWCAPP
jgi:hypothetical protein